MIYDLAVIGGGINGCGIARDAVGRGHSVVLFEQADLGSATSASSTKLIHGGLRYLEHYEFRLVREALIEREVLLRLAPHIIWPLRFVLPHHDGLRPAWLLRLGLFLYDHLGGRKLLPATRTLDLRTDPVGRPLKEGYARAFEYSDCWVEDSRMVVLNARDAADRGAAIRPRTKVVEAKRSNGAWTVTVEDTETGARDPIQARVLVNAAGPWVGEVLSGVVRAHTPSKVRMVQGSHIVVKRLTEHDRCYIFQNADGRIIFAIPYERDFTLIGTTDRDYKGDPAQVSATPEEIAYLARAASEYFKQEIRTSDVVWTYSGVRPLYDDGASKAQEATRDYVLKVEEEDGAAPLLTVFGGKITTYRKLAEAVLAKLKSFLPAGGPWTDGPALPGGDFPVDGYDVLVADIKGHWPFLEDKLARRLVRAYGTKTRLLLDGITSADGMGQVFGADLTEAETRYLMIHEWARHADDVVWRRSKLGLRMTRDEIARLEAWMTTTGAEAVKEPAGYELLPPELLPRDILGKRQETGIA